MALIQKCTCGNEKEFTYNNKHNISIKSCNTCGTIHQDLNMSTEEYFAFYEKEYHIDFQNARGTMDYNERYNHDKNIAKLRLNEYLKYLKTGNRVVDIGSSNNAFVDLINEYNYAAYGVELGEAAKEFKTTYNMDLMDINFPGGYVDMVTLHDVFEHFIDPIVYLKEIHKMLNANGTLVIDYPNYFEEAGHHHWKPIEHLWFHSPEQLEELFDKYGFIVDKVTKPIPSKIVFYLKKKPEQKIKLLFMPGMGDIYWSLTRIESFIAKNDLGVPESYIWDMDQKRIGNQQRSEGFLNRMGFMEYHGTLNIRKTHEFDDFYKHKQAGFSNLQPYWFKENVNNCNYFFNMNGILEIGESLYDDKYGLGDYEQNWYPQLFTPIEEIHQEQTYKEEFGKYIFGYFTGVGIYGEKFNKFLGDRLYSMLCKINRATGAKIVITGTTWDAEASRALLAQDKHNILIDMIEKTNTSQLYALIKGSIGVIGWPAGNTIVATMFKKPTIMFWANIWNDKFPYNIAPPEALNNWYFPFSIEQFGGKLETKVIDTITKTFIDE